ncbi:MAG TPA: glycogen-binding domain-containing protein [Spirochaetia bacterium]|nr:glycogen-binding domain-containing protein [Spirochaetia bacterium]
MIRKAALLVMLGLLVTAWASAEIQLKSLDANTVQITFTFKDDTDSEVGVIGSFDNWTVPGEAMTKNAAGLWEKAIKAAPTDEITYKFYSKGTWMVDPDAPDLKDDGYGGHNGLIVVADILSGAVPAKPVPLAAAPVAGAPGVAAVPGSKLTFGMYTVVGSKATFSTQGVVDKTKKGLELDTAGLYASSYWKVDGTLLPGLRTFINIKAADGYNAFWAQDARGVVSPNANQGLANMAAGLVSNPIYYLGAQNNPAIDTVKLSAESAWVRWETGYQYAKPDDHSGFLWTTLYQQSANNGYMKFDLGKGLRQYGDFTIDATFAPNLMTGNYAEFAWLTVSHPLGKVEFEYDAKSAESAVLSKVFNKLYHQDYLVGLKTKVGPVDVTAQGLMNQFSESPYSQAANLAGEVKAQWSLADDVLGVAAGYRFTGTAATLLFGNNDDSFGTKGAQRYLANVWGKIPGTPVKLGTDTSTLLSVLNPSLGLEYYLKPWVEFDLQGLTHQRSSLNTYVKTYYNFQPGLQSLPDSDPLLQPSSTAVHIPEVGSKLAWANPVPGSINQLYLTYGMNSYERDKILHTLITQFQFPQNLNVDVGLGYRIVRDAAAQSVKDNNNAVGFSVQAAWRVPVAAIRNPLLFGAFVYNIDPYDSGTNNLKLDDNITDGNVAKNDGKAQLRVMMKWDF